MKHCKPTLLALALGLTLGGCALPGPVKKIFGPADQPGAEEQLRAAETALRQKPDDVERRKNVVAKSAALAEEALRAAKTKMDASDDAAALAEVSRLLALAPEHMRAQQLKRQLERRLRLKLELDAAAEIGAQRPQEALERLGRILQEQPGYRQAQALRDELQSREAARRDARPSLAEALRQPVTLNFKVQPISSIFDAISQLAGIDFVFDPEVPVAAPASIVASRTTAEDAINLLLRTHQLEKKVLSRHSMLIYPARSEKAKEYRELMTRAFYLSQANASQVLAALRQISSPRTCIWTSAPMR
ncbi:STN domain-containing protein [Chromobacterium sp. Beijing]|uniref:STN domain-containing protein n=1 Tax=Chromobacterium sp. Beijing TaxID=2735795 RepID=UPI00351D592C